MTASPFKASYLPADRWPQPIQQQWAEAFRAADLFDEPKPALVWRRTTVRKNRNAFGAFVSWTIYDGSFDPDATCEEFVTAIRIRGFLEDLKASTYASNTILCHLQGLYDCARVMDPDADWAWLLNAVKRIRSRARPVRNKLQRLQPAQKLAVLGQELMDQAETDKDLTFYKRALMYRDGLMIATMIHRPLRLNNFASLSLGTSLLLHKSGATLVFPADQMKGKRPFEASFPPNLIPALKIYLEIYRPYLLSLQHEPISDPITGLWISNEGRAMADQSIRNAIKRRTRIAYGCDLTPHLFRDASVTTLVRDAPASAQLTKAILGHSTIETTNKHYNQAKMVDASRRHTSLMEHLINS